RMFSRELQCFNKGESTVREFEPLVQVQNKTLVFLARRRAMLRGLLAMLHGRYRLLPIGVPVGDRVLLDVLVGMKRPWPGHESGVRRGHGRMGGMPLRGVGR